MGSPFPRSQLLGPEGKLWLVLFHQALPFTWAKSVGDIAMLDLPE